MGAFIYLLLGSNEGNRLEQIVDGARLIEAALEGSHTACSSVYETAAWGLENQPAFLNMALRVATTRSPQEVLKEVHRIEQQFGRQREVVWGQRTLDVDILFYGDQIIEHPDLVIPHLQLEHRRFALAPMAELAPLLMHPVLQLTMMELLEQCTDPLPVAILRG